MTNELTTHDEMGAAGEVAMALGVHAAIRFARTHGADAYENVELGSAKASSETKAVIQKLNSEHGYNVDRGFWEDYDHGWSIALTNE